MIKALLSAMLTPNELLKKYQDEGNLTERLALMEEIKTYPMGDIWNYYCEKNGVPVAESWIKEVKEYEQTELSKRK
ncbi:L-rhamnose isomerase [compost metagenome]